MEDLKQNFVSKNKMARISQGPEGTEYCCVSCPAKYTDKEKLELHLVMHNKEYRFLCGICGTGLKRREHLERHTLGHQEVRPHVCQECGKGFKRKEHLNIHMAIHSGDKDQVCPLCQRSFYRKDHLQKHLQTHSKLLVEQNMYSLDDQEFTDIKQEVITNDDNPMITGDLNCEMTMQVDEDNQFNDVGSLLEPMRITPFTDRPYACTLCDKTYKRKDHLKLHSLTHMEKDKICTVCGKAFHKDEQLRSHMNWHRKLDGGQYGDDGGAPYQPIVDHSNIGILPIAIDDSLLLARPNQKVENRPHECPICLRRFKRRQHLKVHANVHAKAQQPTIWCSICNEGFLTNTQFESHQCLAAHADSGDDGQHGHAPQDAKKENSYPPEFVDMSELENTSYAEPEPLVSEQHLPTPQRVYVCKFCTKPFKRKDHYKIHLHIHTGIKSFFCPDCGKGFYRKDHLQKHGSVHQRVKAKPKKEIPDLYPINMLKKTKEIRPEITITAPLNTKLRVPLQIKVPYQVVMSMDNGEQRAVTIDPQAARPREVVS